MNTHEFVLLSPYRYPAQYAMTMSDEDMAAWLNGFTALWHPAVLWQAKGAPRCETTYDHEAPKAGFLYALPETPPAYLKAALCAEGAAALGWKQGLDLNADDVGPLFGLGWGHVLLAALSEA